MDGHYAKVKKFADHSYPVGGKGGMIVVFFCRCRSKLFEADGDGVPGDDGMGS